MLLVLYRTYVDEETNPLNTSATFQIAPSPSSATIPNVASTSVTPIIKPKGKQLCKRTMLISVILHGCWYRYSSWRYCWRRSWRCCFLRAIWIVPNPPLSKATENTRCGVESEARGYGHHPLSAPVDRRILESFRLEPATPPYYEGTDFDSASIFYRNVVLLWMRFGEEG